MAGLPKGVSAGGNTRAGATLEQVTCGTNHFQKAEICDSIRQHHAVADFCCTVWRAALAKPRMLHRCIESAQVLEDHMPTALLAGGERQQGPDQAGG